MTRTESVDEPTPAERAVLEQLDEHALVESLMELVRIPSMGGTDAEVEVQEVAAGMLRDLETDVDRWDIDLDEVSQDPWFPGVEVQREHAVGVVGTIPGQPGEGMPALVLQGHLDVVPPGDPDNWLGSNPFSAEIREGALYGRGACDMKAGTSANLAVARTLRDAGVRLERPLALHCVIGEEDGGLGGFSTLRRGHIGRNRLQEHAVVPNGSAIVRILLQLDELVRLVAHELERSKSDGRILEERMIGQTLEVGRAEDALGQDAVERPTDRRDERRVGLVELDDERVRVRCAEAGDVRGFARAIVGDANDVVELRGVRAT